jgi:hypothetical protein
MFLDILVVHTVLNKYQIIGVSLMIIVYTYKFYQYCGDELSIKSEDAKNDKKVVEKDEDD